MTPRSLKLALRFLFVAAGLVALPLARAQDGAPSRPTFEVAVVRPSEPGQLGGFIKPLPNGGGYTARNITVKLMISLMYEVPARQIQGGPGWLNTELFDVEAKADGAYSKDELHVMFQNLLYDRFGFRFHKEIRQGPVYVLTVDPAGLKMKLNNSPQDFNIPVNGGPNRVVGKRVPMRYLCWWLGQQLQADERPVIDRTGLAQDRNYDFAISFRPQLPPGTPADSLPPEQQDLPSLFTALKDQLGLKLQPQKGPVDFYVIDSLSMPTEN